MEGKSDADPASLKYFLWSKNKNCDLEENFTERHLVGIEICDNRLNKNRSCIKQFP